MLATAEHYRTHSYLDAELALCRGRVQMAIQQGQQPPTGLFERLGELKHQMRKFELFFAWQDGKYYDRGKAGKPLGFDLPEPDDIAPAQNPAATAAIISPHTNRPV